MRRFGVLALGFLAFCSKPIPAQSLKAADLVGWWTKGTGESALIFQPDSTRPDSMLILGNGGPVAGTVRWIRLDHDTLWLRDEADHALGFRVEFTIPNERFVLTGASGSYVYTKLGSYRRLMARPRELAAQYKPPKSGADLAWEERVFPAADSQPGMIYLPGQCRHPPRQVTYAGRDSAFWARPVEVGRRRCPLVVFFWDWPQTMEFVRPMADKYGMILVSAPERAGGVDALLQQVLPKYPIDPDKIALMGTCATGLGPLRIGGPNSGVFSRIISLSAGYHGAKVFTDLIEQMDPPNTTTAFLLAGGLNESSDLFPAVQDLRRRGYRATQAAAFLKHGHQLEIYDYVGRWLQESWGLPDAAQPVPQVVADPLPVLTVDALATMTAFWARFLQEPEVILTTARQAHLRDVAVPVGRERVVTSMTDMAALAALFPSVAADLKAAGLTARQHDAYRVALASTRLMAGVAEAHPDNMAAAVDPNSVLAKNLAFLKAHPDEFAALEATTNGLVRYQGPDGIWVLP